MLDFKEDFLQFIWQHKLLLPKTLISQGGKIIEIIHPGEINTNAGPDFSNAHIKVDGILLVGNVEIHLKSSDWLKHGHQHDNSYNHLVLHAVFIHDVSLSQNELHGVEVLALQPYLSAETLTTYLHFFKSKQQLACANQLGQCSDEAVKEQLEKSLLARVVSKVEKLELLFTFTQHDYTQTFYLCLLRNFGFKVNAEPFELLAKQLPCGILLKHRDNLLQLEAMLLGMAGLLSEPFHDAYPRLLQNEFEFLKNKYRLIPLNPDIFKYSRLRPANFPDSRLAQFAAFLHHCSDVFLAPHKSSDLQAQLKFSCSEYWQSHYQLDGKKVNRTLNIGHEAVENLIINSFVPFLFFYAKKTGRRGIEKKAMEMLQQCGFENNHITKLYAAKKAVFKGAGHSQALLHLYQSCCKKKHCLQCGIAANILKAKAN